MNASSDVVHARKRDRSLITVVHSQSPWQRREKKGWE